jgi:hypothetical protein
MSDLIGKVWRDRDGGQHYILFTWRGVDYKLTFNTRRHKGKILTEAIGSDGSVTWSDADGNIY